MFFTITILKSFEITSQLAKINHEILRTENNFWISNPENFLLEHISDRSDNPLTIELHTKSDSNFSKRIINITVDKLLTISLCSVWSNINLLRFSIIRTCFFVILSEKFMSIMKSFYKVDICKIYYYNQNV